MVNVPGRSKGCATCRKRKVKCDESLPECLRCLNMGLRCPGARSEAFFVHAVSKSSLCNFPSQNLVASPPLPRPPPSRASAFDQLFVSHFIESFFGPMQPPPIPGAPTRIWLHDLPVFMASSGPPLAKHAIRATSMLSYGSLVNDASITIAARNWYTQALQDLRCLLSSKNIAFSEGAICAVIMLIHFETWAGTSDRAWVQHVKGAVTLMESGGPEYCRTGFMHQVFSHLRLQAFMAAMSDNIVSPFASDNWMTIPFEIYPKLIFDQIVDALFMVQRCLSIADQVIKSTGDAVCRLMTKLDELIDGTTSQLHQWYIKCISITRLGKEKSMHTPNYETGTDMSCNPEPPLIPHTNVPTAALGSLYDAANVILFRLLHIVSPSAVDHNIRVHQHAQSILTANQFINATTGPTPDRGSTMMVFQLKVVSMWSSSSQQRDAASRMLQGEKVQCGGLSDISVSSHEYFADVAAHILKHHSNE